MRVDRTLVVAVVVQRSRPLGRARRHGLTALRPGKIERMLSSSTISHNLVSISYKIGTTAL